MDDQRAWGAKTIAAIGQEGFRGDVKEAQAEAPVVLQSTGWAIAQLSDEGLERLTTFVNDLTRRYPLTGPAWEAHRIVMESLAVDLDREAEARRVMKNGQ